MTLDSVTLLWYVAVGVTLLTGGMAITGLLRARRHIARLEQALHQAQGQLTNQQAAILAGFQAHEHERRNVARIIHDDVATMLSVVKLSVSQLRPQQRKRQRVPVTLLDAFAPESQMVREDELVLERTRALLDQTVGNLRRLNRTLAPTTLDRFGLVAALEELTEYTATPDLTVRFECPMPSPLPFNRVADVALYRVAQIVVNNVVQHARARRLTLRLRYVGMQAELTVIDDGQGFLPEKTQRGRSLLLAEAHLRALCGQFHYVSKPGEGTVVTAQLPILPTGN